MNELLSGQKINDLLKLTPNWLLYRRADKTIKFNQIPNNMSTENFVLRREYKFINYVDPLDFLERIVHLAVKQYQYPDIFLGWGILIVTLTDMNGLTKEDFMLAQKINMMKD